MNIENIPEELKEIRQWVMWKKETRKGKETKVPYQPNGNRADSTKPQTWNTFQSCINASGFDGIGFVFTDDDPYAGIDWDDVRNPTTGEFLSGIYEEITGLESYAEVSQSGEGAHAIVKADKPGSKCKKKDRNGTIEREMYDRGRFFVMTGDHIPDTPETVNRPDMATFRDIYSKIDRNDKPQQKEQADPDKGNLSLSDSDILRKCETASNGDKFRDLWNGSTFGYGGDHSGADMALCSLLAFWTRDPTQIDRLFRQSDLMRTKWDEKRGYQTYGDRTISEALQHVTETYEPKKPNQEPEITKEHLQDEMEKRGIEQYPDHIIDKANELLQYGDPFKFIVDTWNRHHVGDRAIGEAAACAVASTYMINSKGLHIKPSGDSGKGKSDGAKKFLHLLPEHKKLCGSLSGKSMFYNPHLKSGTIIYTDDVQLNDDIVSTVKQSITNFQTETTHNTVKKQEFQEYSIPPRISWWMTSVDGFDDDQMGNRFLGVDVDGSAEQDEKVFQHQAKMERLGITDDIVDDSVLICRAVFDILGTEEYKIVFPYTTLIQWNNKDNRRNFGMFMDILKSVAFYRVKQREQFHDVYLAEVEDFHRAKEIYKNLAESNATNLTEIELKIMRWMSGKVEVDIKQVAEFIGKSEATAKRYIHGRDGNGGLLAKVTGLSSEKVRVETTRGRTTTKNVYSYSSNMGLNSYDDVVNIHTEGIETEYHNFKKEYNEVMGGDCSTIPPLFHESSKKWNSENHKQDTVYNKINYTIPLNKEMHSGEGVTANCDYPSHFQPFCGTVTTDSENGWNSDGTAWNSGTVKPQESSISGIPDEDMAVFVDKLTTYAKNHYPDLVINDISGFAWDFALAYPDFKRAHGIGGIKELAERMNERGWN